MTSLASKGDFSEKELQLLNMEYTKRRKSTLTAYLLWLFLGFLLIHRIYIGRTKYVIFIVSYTLILLFLFITMTFLSAKSEPILNFMTYMDYNAGGIPFLIPYLWGVFDIFRIHSMVMKANDELENKIILKIKQNRKKKIS